MEEKNIPGQDNELGDLENETLSPAPQPPGPSKGMDDFAVIQKAERSKDGRKFKALMNGMTADYEDDWPKAAMALLCILAFWTRKNKAQMERIFRTSGLMRDEWDRMDAEIPELTVGQVLIESAVAFVKDVYLPRIKLNRTADQLTVHTPEGDVLLSDFHPEKKRLGMYGWDDIGAARLVADVYKRECRYVPERKKWYVYRDGRWCPDNLEATRCVAELFKALQAYARSLPAPADPERDTTRADYIKYTEGLLKAQKCDSILALSASFHPMSISEFDKDPFILNVLNGELDLRNGILNGHSPESYLTKMANVSYDPSARCARFEQHMDEVSCGDTDLKEYMQKAFGYSLTGSTNYECFFFLYGPTTRNGKSTSVEAISYMLGDYGRNGRPETLAQKFATSGGAASEDIARLAGARIVIFSEPSNQMKLSASLIKTLTGNDTLLSRYLYENSFEYRPNYKIFINTNHLPDTKDATLFRSGRVKVLPFNARFVGSNQDKGLKEEFKKPENLSGILNWCIEGLRLLESQGFDEPQAVLEATGRYEADSDTIGKFINETLVASPGSELLTDDVYAGYCSWCIMEGSEPESKQCLKQGMATHGIMSQRRRPADPNLGTNPRNMYVGYTWASTDADS